MDLMMNATNSTNGTEADDEFDGTLGSIDAILTITTLVIIMLGMGATQTLKELWKIIKRPFGIIVGFVVQFILMPLTGFGLAHAFDLSPALAISTVIMTCCPGGSMSNLFTYYSLGDVSLSICMTTCSTFLAIGMMPLDIFLFTGKWTDDTKIAIPYVNVASSLATIVIPTVAGLIINWKLPRKFTNILTQVCSALGLLGIFAGIALRAYANPEVYISSWETWVLAAILPPFGFIYAFLISSSIHMSYKKRRTTGIECGCQNLSLALTVINLTFPVGPLRAEMQILPSIYGPLMGAEACIFIICYRLYHRFIQKNKDVPAVSEDDVKAIKEVQVAEKGHHDDVEMNGHTNEAADVYDDDVTLVVDAKVSKDEVSDTEINNGGTISTTNIEEK
ncbi:ileal sodium/bile acid cotransporter-like [Glandiceps talaboti]